MKAPKGCMDSTTPSMRSPRERFLSCSSTSARFCETTSRSLAMSRSSTLTRSCLPIISSVGSTPGGHIWLLGSHACTPRTETCTPAVFGTARTMASMVRSLAWISTSFSQALKYCRFAIVSTSDLSSMILISASIFWPGLRICFKRVLSVGSMTTSLRGSVASCCMPTSTKAWRSVTLTISPCTNMPGLRGLLEKPTYRSNSFM
mmetsp:Transcript_32247/g.79871  ORF Transcript_32247/g.79871 Transcript_32247/m.79871 type:complete len:204 (-) Transcript_32247:250-861(-)